MQKPQSKAPGATMTLLSIVLLAGTTNCESPHAKTPAAAVRADPLARTPPMGFNNWNAFGCDVSEALIKETADFFVSSGLKNAGYQFVNIDDCWSLKERGAQGQLVPDPKKFPSGMRALADYVHGKGLKLGIYGDAGTKTCAGYPGSLGKEELDAKTWADWGVDYVKYDNCFNQSDGSRSDYVKRYTAMRDAIDQTGRAMVYSICEWGTSQPWQWATGVGHLWRTTGDISDNWTSVRSIIAINAPLAAYAGPGHWNDPDMLEIGNGGLTPTESRTHMSMWAMMAAPLIIGTDLRKVSAEDLSILSNEALIAIDQDPLGRQAVIVVDDQGSMVLDKPLSSGEHAIALYNSTDALAVVSVPAAKTGLPAAEAYRLVDVWTSVTTETARIISAGVPAHGTVVYRASPVSAPAALPPSVSLGASLAALIRGQSAPGALTTTVSNRGVAPAHTVEVSLTPPGGWAVTSAGPTARERLANDESFDTKWNVEVPAGTAPGTYPIRMTATYAWGEPASNGARAKASVTTELSSVVVAAPADGTTHLSQLVPVRSKNGTGTVELDMSNGAASPSDGNLITIAGKVYTRGLGTHAPSEVRYYLGRRCSSLTTDVGIDDGMTQGGAASFAIYADDKLVAKSGAIAPRAAATTLTADVTGAEWLTLVTSPAESNAAPHTDWAAPRLVCGASTQPTLREKTLFSFESGSDGWAISNAEVGGSVGQSTLFVTDGKHGLQVVAPNDGNWFGRTFAEPVDLSAYSSFKFDVNTAGTGTSAEIAVQVGAAKSWCQGGLWTWTNPNSKKTIRAAASGIKCPQGVRLDLSQVHGVWAYLKGGTFQIDNVRAE